MEDPTRAPRQTPTCPANLAAVQQHFLQAVPPHVQHHADYVFRDLKDPGRGDDLAAEMAGLAWAWTLRLLQLGKDPAEFPTALAGLVARAVRSGRRLTGMARAKDVLNPHAQARRGFRVEQLPDASRSRRNPSSPRFKWHELHEAFEERLRDNRVTPVPDQVQFRIDWPEWLATLSDRDRPLIEAMANNERTTDLSRRFALSPARVSQLRREFRDGWRCFREGY